ncbi:hypothetical protein S7711_05130 [Stachybotrys chartarum IBT 7711]|uniref:Major facilitator superfamily (MFS) profile domain-containing protein n=1 Tax=Stachybotrys chartarum (strain CBS 109288 / IBT 7711) TaxID=1280523 RepID=A0A084B4H6_STACB|nr:hypothetical protein S7711_05130 [Stachybotrys chartarum IBT 7711]
MAEPSSSSSSSSSPPPEKTALEATESTALLSGTTPIPVDDASPKPSFPPLPKLQILLLCSARMVEPIAFFAIFPFIAQMVQRNGHLPASAVGFYSGLIESLFSATQVLVLIVWGRLADSVGRRPVLLASLIGMTAGCVLFGMARSLWQMILFRCVAGVFSGSNLIIRTMIAEHSAPETQARAFSWFAFAGNLGIFLGPLIGGALADPVSQYPRAFKGVRFFEEYPYALPGFVTGGVSAMTAIAIALFLKETLHTGAASRHSSDASEPASEPLSVWELLKFPNVPIVLLVNSHVMFLAFAFTALLPVVLFTPVSLGGLGLTPFQISIYTAAQGASQALWLLLVFPPLQYRIGTKGVLRICAAVYPFFFCGYIAMNLLLRDHSHTARVCFWILGPCVALIGPGVSMAFTATQLALNDVSPNPQVLGTLNALALTAASAIRCVAPGLATAVYAAGVTGQILGGHLAWVILIPLSAPFLIGLRWLPEGKIPAKQRLNFEEE